MVLNISTEKLSKFGDLHRNLDGLKLADLARTNKACGGRSLSIEETPKPVSPPAFSLWARCTKINNRRSRQPVMDDSAGF